MSNRSDTTAVALAGAASVDTPEVTLDPGRRLLRRLARASSRIASVVTVVPFVPVQARVVAGAVTGVATAVEVALRPRKDRPSALAYIPQDEKQITADPVLFATDAASVLASTAISATRAISSGTRRILTRRAGTVVAVVGVTVAGTYVVYRFVVQPVMRRRALRDWAETQEAWGPPDAAAGALPGAEVQATGSDTTAIGSGVTPAGDARASEGAALIETVGLAKAADGSEVLIVEIDASAVDAALAVDTLAVDAKLTGDAAGEPDLGPHVRAAASPADDAPPVEGAEGAETPKKKRRLGRG